MADPGVGPSAGELGGIFAGAVAMLVALGHGLRWWLGWTDRRAATRAAKLDAWQKQLEERERELWAKVEAEIGSLRSQHAALLGGYQLIAAELRLLKPDSDALRRADELLRSAFLLDPLLPTDIAAIARTIHRSTDTD